MNRYDVVVVLGAQIVRIKENLGFPGLEVVERVVPAYHTELRAHAAGIVYEQGLTPRFIVSGGHNVGVRYDFETNKVFPKPNFSFEAFARARREGPSEAQVIQELMVVEYHVPEEAILIEDLSATTQENALFVRRILARSLDPSVSGTALSSLKNVGLVTLLYHMERVLKDFREAGVNVEPVYAEDILALDDSRDWAEEIAKYYSSPKGGKQWDVERIREIMLARSCGDTTRTIHELAEGGE